MGRRKRPQFDPRVMLGHFPRIIVPLTKEVSMFLVRDIMHRCDDLMEGGRREIFKIEG
jgi:hypothetical protein